VGESAAVEGRLEPGVDEEPRICVFICHCGTNIAGFLVMPYITDTL